MSKIVAFFLVWLAKKIGIPAQEFEKIVNDAVKNIENKG